MKLDLRGNIDRITDFLEWSVTPEQMTRVIKYSSFEWMKSNDEKFSSQGDAGIQVFKPGQFIRQGKVDKYHDLVTPELEKRILDLAYATLESDCLDFLDLQKTG